MKLETYITIVAWVAMVYTAITLICGIMAVATDPRYKFNAGLFLFVLVFIVSLGWILCK